MNQDEEKRLNQAADALLERIGMTLKESDDATLLAGTKAAEATAHTKSLRELIINNGARTNNPFRDALMVSNNLALLPPTMALLERYAELDKQIRGQQGEPLLLSVATACVTNFFQDFYLGILTGEGLIVDIPEGKINLPLRPLAIWSEDDVTTLGGSLSLTDQGGHGLELSWLNRHVLDQERPSPNESIFVDYIGPTRSNQFYSLEILTGQTAIKEWYWGKQPSKYALIYQALAAAVGQEFELEEPQPA